MKYLFMDFSSFPLTLNGILEVVEIFGYEILQKEWSDE